MAGDRTSPDTPGMDGRLSRLIRQEEAPMSPAGTVANSSLPVNLFERHTQADDDTMFTQDGDGSFREAPMPAANRLQAHSNDIDAPSQNILAGVDYADSPNLTSVSPTSAQWDGSVEVAAAAGIDGDNVSSNTVLHNLDGADGSFKKQMMSANDRTRMDDDVDTVLDLKQIISCMEADKAAVDRELLAYKQRLDDSEHARKAADDRHKREVAEYVARSGRYREELHKAQERVVGLENELADVRLSCQHSQHEVASLKDQLRVANSAVRKPEHSYDETFDTAQSSISSDTNSDDELSPDGVRHNSLVTMMKNLSSSTAAMAEKGINRLDALNHQSALGSRSAGALPASNRSETLKPGPLYKGALKSALANSQDLVARLQKSLHEQPRSSTPTRQTLFSNASAGNLPNGELGSFEIDASAMLNDPMSEIFTTIGRISAELAANMERAQQAETVFEQVLNDQKQEIATLEQQLEVLRCEKELATKASERNITDGAHVDVPALERQVTELKKELAKLQQELQDSRDAKKELQRYCDGLKRSGGQMRHSSLIPVFAAATNHTTSPLSPAPSTNDGSAEIARLRADIELLCGEKSDLAAKLDDALKRDAVLQASESHLKEMVDKARVVVAERDAAASTMQASITELKAVHARTQIQLSKLGNELEAARSELGSLKAKDIANRQANSRLEREATQLNAQIVALNEECVRAVHDANAVRQLLSERETELANVKSESISVTEEVETLRSKIAQLTGENKRLLMTASQATTDAKQNSAKESIVQQLTAELNVQKVEFENAIAELSERLSGHDHASSEKVKMINSLTVRLEDIQKRKNQGEQFLRAAKSDKARVERELESVRSRAESLRSQLELATTELGQQIQSLTSTNSQLEADVAEKEKQLLAIEKRRAELESKCRMNAVTIDRLKDELSRKRDNSMRDINTELQTALAENVRLQAELNGIQQALVEVRAERELALKSQQQLLDDVMSKENEITSLINDRDDLSSQIQSAQTEISSLRKQLESKTDLLSAEKSALAELRQEKKCLKQNLEALDNSCSKYREMHAKVAERLSALEALHDKVSLKVEEVLAAVQNGHIERNSKLSELGIGLSAARSRLEAVDGALQADMDTMSEVVAERDNLKQKVSGLEEALRSRDLRLTNVKARMGSLAQEKTKHLLNSPIKSKLKFSLDLKQEADSNEADLMEKVHKLDQTQLNDFKRQIEELQNEKLSFQESIAELQIKHVETIGALERKAEYLESELYNHQLEAHRMESDLQKQSEVHRKMLRNVDAYSKELHTLQNAIAAKHRQMTDLQSTISDLKLKNLEMEATVTNLKLQLQSSHSSAEEMRHKHETALDSLASEQRQRDAAIEGLRAELKQAQQLLESSKAASAENAAQFTTTVAQLVAQQEENEAQKAIIRDLESRLETKSSEFQNLEQKMKQLVNESEATMLNLRADVEAAREANDSLKSELANVTSRIDSCQAACDAALVKKDQLVNDKDTELTSVRKKVSELTSELDTSKAVVDEHIKTQIKLRAEIDELKQAQTTKNADNSKLEEQLRGLHSHVVADGAALTEMTKQLADRDSELAAARRESEEVVKRLEADHSTNIDILHSKALENSEKLRDEIAALKKASDQQIGSLLEERKSRESELATLRSKLDGSNLDLQQSLAQQVQLKEHLRQMDMKNRDLEERLSAAGQQQRSLLIELETKSSEINRLQSAMAVKEQELNQLSAVLSELEVSAANFKDRAEYLQSEIDREKGVAEQVKLQLSELASHVGATSSETTEAMIQALKKAIDVKLQELEAVKKGEADLQIALDEATSKAKLMENETARLREDVDRLTSQAEEKRKLIASLEKSKRNYKNSVSEQEVALQAKVAEVDDCRREMNALSDMMTGTTLPLKKRIQELSAQVAVLESENGELATRADSLSREVESKAGALAAANADMTSAELARLSLEQNNSELASKCQQLLAELDQVKNSLLLKEGETSILQVQYRDILHKHNVSSDENAALKTTIEDLERRSNDAVTNLKSELSQITRQYEQYESMKLELQHTNDELRDALGSAEDKHAKLQDKIVHLESNQQKLILENESAASRLKHLEVALAHKNETIADLQMQQTVGHHSLRVADEEKLAKFHEQLDQSERLRTRLEKYLNKLQKDKAALQQQCAKLQNDLESEKQRADQLQARATENDDEAQFILKQLGDAAHVLKCENQSFIASSFARAETAPAVPRNHNRRESEVERSLRENNEELEKNIDQIVSRSLSEVAARPAPVLVTSSGKVDPKMEALVQSLSHVPLADVVVQYETKLQTLHSLLERGEQALKKGVDMVLKKEQRKRSAHNSKKLLGRQKPPSEKENHTRAPATHNV